MSIFSKLVVPVLGVAFTLAIGMASHAQVSGANTFEKLKPGELQAEKPKLIKPGVPGASKGKKRPNALKCGTPAIANKKERAARGGPGVPSVAYGEERPAAVDPLRCR